MHSSRLCAVLIDCNTTDIDAAASFWAKALGRQVDAGHPGTRGNYRMLETPPDEPIVQIQRVQHESRVHIDIETDDIPAEVARLEKLGANVVEQAGALGGDAGPDGAAILRGQGSTPGLSEERNALVMTPMERLAGAPALTRVVFPASRSS